MCIISLDWKINGKDGWSEQCSEYCIQGNITPPPPPFYFHSVVGKFKTIGKFQQDRLISFHMPVSGWIYETKPFTSV